MGKKAKLPKSRCCVSKSKCGRCPLRMLKEGTLPAGYTVKKRALVRVDNLEPLRLDKGGKPGSQKGKKKKKGKKSAKKAGRLDVAA